MKFLDWLQLLFIYLQLTHQINWNWALVLCPFWVTMILSIVLRDKE